MALMQSFGANQSLPREEAWWRGGRGGQGAELYTPGR